jgi:c-di-GMP-related signal transduction protein
MVKATKATRQRLKKLKNINNTLAEILIERIEIAENIEACINDGFTLTQDDYSKGFYSNDNLYIKAQPWEKPYFSGFYTKYPSLISTTFTHGLNEVQIPDINKMVKAMLRN